MRSVVASPHHRCALHPHPSAATRVVESVTVEIHEGPRLQVRFEDPANRLVLPNGVLDPTHLWEHTCVELFMARSSDARYVEWNFSPTGQVARFEFDSYRQRTAETFPEGFRVRCERADRYTQVVVEGPMLDTAFDTAAITAVVRNRAGQCGYWALSHPRAEADFHDAAGFVLPRSAFG